jgi:hypothetical protein
LLKGGGIVRLEPDRLSEEAYFFIVIGSGETLATFIWNCCIIRPLTRKSSAGWTRSTREQEPSATLGGAFWDSHGEHAQNRPPDHVLS